MGLSVVPFCTGFPSWKSFVFPKNINFCMLVVVVGCELSVVAHKNIGVSLCFLAQYPVVGTFLKLQF